MIDVRKRKEYSFSSDLTGIKVILFALWYFASGVEHFCIGLKTQSPLLCRVTMECFEKAVKLFTSKEINNTGPVVSRNVKLAKTNIESPAGWCENCLMILWCFWLQLRALFKILFLTLPISRNINQHKQAGLKQYKNVLKTTHPDWTVHQSQRTNKKLTKQQFWQTLSSISVQFVGSRNRESFFPLYFTW